MANEVEYGEFVREFKWMTLQEVIDMTGNKFVALEMIKGVPVRLEKQAFGYNVKRRVCVSIGPTNLALEPEVQKNE